MASDLEIRIGAELSEIKGALASLQKDLTKVDRQAKDTGKDALGGLQNGISGAVTAVQGLVAAFAALQVGTKFIELADQAQNFQARLRLVTNSTAEFQQALTGVQKIATATRQPLADVADLYTRLAQNLTDSPERLLDLTQTISKAVTLSGSSAQAAQAAIVQLGQGLAAGQLRGQELNSVLEQTPRLARAIEEGLGLARGGLRAFAEEGKVSAEAIKQALASQAETIDKEFSQLPTTIGQSFTLLNNAALQYVGVLDQANGLSAGFSTTIKALADNFNLLAGAIGAVVSIPLAIAFGRAAQAIGGLIVGLRAATVATGGLAAAMRLLGGPIGAVLSVLGLAASAYAAFGTKTEQANNQAERSTKKSTEEIVKSVERRIEKLNQEIKALEDRNKVPPPPSDSTELKDALATKLERERAYLKAIDDLRKASTQSERDRLSAMAQGLGIAYKNAANVVSSLQQAEAQALRSRQKAEAKTFFEEYKSDIEKLNAELDKWRTKLGAEFTPEVERRIRAEFAKGSASDLKGQLDAEERLLKDSEKRQLDSLEKSYEQGLITTTAYFNDRLNIELVFIDKQIKLEQTRARLLKGADKQKALAEIEILGRARDEATSKNSLARTKALAEDEIRNIQNLSLTRKASTDNALADIERLFTDGQVTIRRYFAERERLDQAALDRELAIENKRIELGGKEGQEAIERYKAIEIQKQGVREKYEAEEKAAQQKLADDITNIRIASLQEQGRVGEAEQLRLELQYRDLLKRLQTEGNAAGIDLVKNLINASAAKAQFDDLKAQFDRVLETLQQRQISLNAQRDTGAISGDTASAQMKTARQDAISQLTTLNEKLQELAVNSNNPAIVTGALTTANALRQLGIDSATGLEKAAISLRSSLEQMKQGFAENALQAGADALSGLFNDLANGSKSAGDAIRDFARNVALSIAQLAARILATWATIQFINLLPGGPAVLKMMDISAGVKHGGGMAGTGPLRRVNPLLFAGAPRYHSGGMVGLKPGEVPAILQTGEEVLSRRDPRNAANGGSGTNVRIINSIDPELAAEYFNSPSGEKTFVNLISRNAATLRNVLA